MTASATKARAGTLTPAMRAAMEDLRRGPLTPQPHGWANEGVRGHATGVIRALVARGLVDGRKMDAPRRTDRFVRLNEVKS